MLLKFRTRRQSLIVQRRVGHAHGVFKHLAVTEEADLCFHSGMLLRARTRGAFGNKLCEGRCLLREARGRLPGEHRVECAIYARVASNAAMPTVGSAGTRGEYFSPPGWQEGFSLYTSLSLFAGGPFPA